MQSNAATVDEYLQSLPPDRRAAIAAVRQAILDNKDADIEEGMQYGMIGYYVPHRVFPRGYHCDPSQPVPYASIASQKNHMAVYLMCVYGSEAMEQRLREGFAKAGKRLDMGKSCLRFKRIEDISLDAIGDVIRRASAAKYLESYVAAVPEKAWKTTAKVKAPASTKQTTAKEATKKEQPASRAAQKTTPTKSRRADGGPASNA